MNSAFKRTFLIKPEENGETIDKSTAPEEEDKIYIYFILLGVLLKKNPTPLKVMRRKGLHYVQIDARRIF